MLAYTYISPGKFELIDKPNPELQSPRDATDYTPLQARRHRRGVLSICEQAGRCD